MTERGELVLMVAKLQAENAQLWRDLKAADQKTDKLLAVAEAAREAVTAMERMRNLAGPVHRIALKLAALDATDPVKSAECFLSSGPCKCGINPTAKKRGTP